MRWIKQKQLGKRMKTRFLLFPKCINGEWRWFEKATWQEYYREPNLLWTADYWIN